MRMLTDDTATRACPHCDKEHLSGVHAARYLRISEDREGEELGVERQRQDTSELACREGVLLVAEYVDNDIGASTKTKKTRPDYTRMLKDARTGLFTMVLAYTSKRITRQPRENEDLIELAIDYGITYRYVRSPSFDLNTANGRAVARTLAAWDANESEEMGERVSRAYRQRIQRGGFAGGGRRYGFESDGVTRREDECDEIKRAAEAVLAGASLRGLARELNDKGKLTTNGKRWDALAVRQTLLRERNAGYLVYQGQIVRDEDGEPVPAPWEPIVPEGTEDAGAFWEAVWAKLKDASRRTSPGNKPKWLASGIAQCGHPDCIDHDRPMRVGGSKKGYSFPAYRCAEKQHTRIIAPKLDEFIEHGVLAYLARPEAADLLDTSEAIDTSKLATERNALEARIAEAKQAWEDGIFTYAEMKSRSQRLREQLKEIDAQLEVAGEADPLAGIAGQETAAKVWAELDLERKRKIVDRLMEITIMPAKRGRLPNGEYFDSSRVVVTWRTE